MTSRYLIVNADAISREGLCKILKTLPSGVSEMSCHPEKAVISRRCIALSGLRNCKFCATLQSEPRYIVNAGDSHLDL